MSNKEKDDLSPVMKDLIGRHQYLLAENQMYVKKLVQEGIGVDGFTMDIMVRIKCLIAMLCPEQEDKIRFEIAVEEEKNTHLSGMVSSTASKLHVVKNDKIAMPRMGIVQEEGE